MHTHTLHDVIVSVPSEGSSLMDEGARFWSQVVDARSGVARELE